MITANIVVQAKISQHVFVVYWKLTVKNLAC